MLYMNYVKLDCTQIEGLFHSVYFYCGFDSNMKRQGQSQYFRRSMQKEKNELKRAKRSQLIFYKVAWPLEVFEGRENRIMWLLDQKLSIWPLPHRILQSTFYYNTGYILIFSLYLIAVYKCGVFDILQSVTLLLLLYMHSSNIFCDCLLTADPVSSYVLIVHNKLATYIHLNMNLKGK